MIAYFKIFKKNLYTFSFSLFNLQEVSVKGLDRELMISRMGFGLVETLKRPTLTLSHLSGFSCFGVVMRIDMQDRLEGSVWLSTCKSPNLKSGEVSSLKPNKVDIIRTYTGIS